MAGQKRQDLVILVKVVKGVDSIQEYFTKGRKNIIYEQRVESVAESNAESDKHQFSFSI